MNEKFNTPAQATLYDWALLIAIVAMGGSAFALIRVGLETIPPSAIAVGRLWVGAGFLYAVMRYAGRRFPPFFIRANGRLRIRRSWGSMIAVGATGYVLPFFLFPWAQQYVESGLAGVYMAFMPIWTLALAFFFAGEKADGRKIIGFILGFAGVIILMGPEVVTGAGHTDLRAQGALLLATFLYAASAIYARRAAPIRPRIFAAGVVLVGAVMATPTLFFTDLRLEEWSAASLASVVALGVAPTGIAAVCIIILIRRAGAGFMSLVNYITPLWAVAMGALFFGERLQTNAFIALAVILIGVAIAQRIQRRDEKETPTVQAGDLQAAVENQESADQTKI